MQGGHTQKSNTANALSAASLWKVAAELRFEPHRIRSVYFQAGCKAHLLQLLYLLAQQFRSADFLRSELMRQQERATRLRPVFEYVSQNFAENLTLKQGAALASISQPQFIKLFQRVAVIVELWTPCTKTLEETLALERAWATESLHYLSTLASESLGPPF